MKAGIHPTYHSDMRITCVCGAEIKTGSTQQAGSIELCSSCHPFYTGQQKIVDTARRVEKFNERASLVKSDAKIGHAAKAEKKAQRAAARQAKREKAEMAK